jgi:transketolase
VAIVATGAQVGEAVKAAKVLEGDGVSAAVINVHTIAPLEEEALLAAVSGSKAIVTVEDHSIHGGLGGAVAEVLSSRNGSTPRLRRIGMSTFGESGTTEGLYAKYGLDADGIVRTTTTFLQELG